MKFISICNCFCQLINFVRSDMTIAGWGFVSCTLAVDLILCVGYVLRDPVLY